MKELKIVIYDQPKTAVYVPRLQTLDLDELRTLKQIVDRAVGQKANTA